MDYLDEDSPIDEFKTNQLTLTETINMAENQPLWRLLAVSGAAHWLLAVSGACRNDGYGL